MTITKSAQTGTRASAPRHRGHKLLFAAVAVTGALIVAFALWLWLPSSSHSNPTVHSGHPVRVQTGHYDRCAPRPGTRYC